MCEAIALPLLGYDALEFCEERAWDTHVSQAKGAVTHSEEGCQLAARLRNRHRASGEGTRARLRRLGRVDHIPQFLGISALAIPRCPSCHLHGDGVELSNLPLRSTTNERLDLVSCGHRP